ncbi:WD repeat protein [Aspergillus puulaauensis]|uniref:WD repeat protein n=1 Tax=Aspergillus puulaauensis TaxID=1220207 RepID=A0A7R7XTL9_9EURO|nr:uncharacterized protein APUU_60559S [Aspergillus puulaauensis]BCS27511.1 hypothetical protein APUU_60559S [Aspergillus puulaauensis]
MGRDSLNSRNSITSTLLGSDDPSMIKESEDLLSKFIRGASNEARDAFLQPQNTGSPVTNLATERSKARVKIPRGNIQLRPQSNSRPTEHVPPKAPANPASMTKRTVTLPSPRRKPPSSQRKQAAQSPSPDSDVPLPGSAVIRRSGRSRAGPTNYYEKFPLLNSEDEGKVQKIKTVPIPRGPLRCPRYGIPSTTPQPPASRISRQQNTSFSSLFQQRELGAHSNRQLYSQFTGGFKVSKAWKGASNDVVSLAWSPDGTRFAAGATAQCDEHMMAYNRKNNLLFGNLTNSELCELPDHCIPRPGGTGSASHVVNDSRLFMSVTAVQWFEDTLYTASYDHTVKLWDTSRGKATCHKTLKHDSKVIVMARSNFAENILATGTHMIGYWDTNDAEYTALELPRARSRKEIELVPTSIAWGSSHATKDYLLAGMSDKEDGVAQYGLLAAFRFRESSVGPEYFSPNSQNVFDVAWHPTLPIFGAACTAGQQVTRGTRSVVNIYEPLRLKSRVLELDCPALDMNEVTFCPANTNYVSTSCTDGVTYVWDMRNCGEIVHKLKHGAPLNQLDETVPREQADTGVNMQLWGSTSDQLYTGASDGVVKRWNILRAPDDVLVEDTAALNEGIMCGAFSPDQSNLLIGDVSGGVHLLSNSPFCPDDAPAFIFKESPHCVEQEPDPDSGVRAAQDLVSSGQIEIHPVFGPGKGPHYKGPFAAWARPIGTSPEPERVASTQLADYYTVRQLCGMPPQYREGLKPEAREEVEGHITLATVRNQMRGRNKRRNPEAVVIKTECVDEHDFIDLCSDEGVDEPAYKISPKRRQPVISTPDSVTIEVIDLTGDSDMEDFASSQTSSLRCSRRGGGSVRPAILDDHELEDDYWWPDSSTINPNFSE